MARSPRENSSRRQDSRGTVTKGVLAVIGAASCLAPLSVARNPPRNDCLIASSLSHHFDGF
jgi:hypothetical protein